MFLKVNLNLNFVFNFNLHLIYLFLHIGEDYQELTQWEEKDLEYMISQTENAISNIEAFTEQLSKDLSVLDGVTHEIKMLILNNPYYLIGDLQNDIVTI